MPNLTSDATEAVRLWLRERDWDYQRLADECNSLTGLDPDDWAAGGVRNAVNGYDPVRSGRINRISRVTKAHPTPSFPHGLTYNYLVGNDEDEPPASPEPPAPRRDEPTEPTVERTAPPGRRNGRDDQRGPARAEASTTVGVA